MYIAMKMNKIKIFCLVAVIGILLCACGGETGRTADTFLSGGNRQSTEKAPSDTEEIYIGAEDAAQTEYFDTENAFDTAGYVTENAVSIAEETYVYHGVPYVEVNSNRPFFEETDYTCDAFEIYAPPDELGRCGTAYANICTEIMPKEERGAIGSVKPTGWHTVKYNGIVDGNYLYNRCHLIAFELAGENANERNLITGTRYMNVEGMLPFENCVADYVRDTGNHVLYRVTPVFSGENLVADGVLMEAYSVEDAGAGIQFCVFVYNVQPGIAIDYATGDSRIDETAGVAQSGESNTGLSEQSDTKYAQAPDRKEDNCEADITYVLNTNTRRFHKPSCPSVGAIKQRNRQDYCGTRDAVIRMGYTPCGNCHP